MVTTKIAKILPMATFTAWFVTQVHWELVSSGCHEVAIEGGKVFPCFTMGIGEAVYVWRGHKNVLKVSKYRPLGGQWHFYNCHLLQVLQSIYTTVRARACVCLNALVGGKRSAMDNSAWVHNERLQVAISTTIITQIHRQSTLCYYKSYHKHQLNDAIKPYTC